MIETKNDYVLLKPIEEEDESPIMFEDKKEIGEFEVIYTSPLESNLKEGSTVLIYNRATREVEIKGEKLTIAKEQDVIGVLNA